MENTHLWIQGVIAFVAVIAFFRPEITNILGRFFGDLAFYKSSGLLEIGFSEFGPTIGLSGSIASVTSNHLISSMNLKVTRLDDEATYDFSWGVFREYNLGNINDAKIDIAYPFNLRSGETRNLNIQFHDIKTKEKIKEPVIKVIDAHRKFVHDNNIYIDVHNPEELHKQLEMFKADKSNNDLVVVAYTAITDEFYWKESNYKVELIISTNVKDFSFVFNFDLAKEESNQLKLNAVTLTENAMQMNAHHFFVHKPWIMKERKTK